MTRQNLTLTRETPRTWGGGLGILVAGIGLTFLGGMPGLVAACLTAAGWWILPAQYAFTIGHFALAALLPEMGNPEIGVVAIVEAGLILLLADALDATERQGQLVAGAVGGISVTVVVVWASAQWVPALWLRGFGLLAVGALVGYWMHRYERTALGVLDDTATGDHE